MAVFRISENFEQKFDDGNLFDKVANAELTLEALTKNKLSR